MKNSASAFFGLQLAIYQLDNVVNVLLSTMKLNIWFYKIIGLHFQLYLGQLRLCKFIQCKSHQFKRSTDFLLLKIIPCIRLASSWVLFKVCSIFFLKNDVLKNVDPKNTSFLFRYLTTSELLQQSTLFSLSARWRLNILDKLNDLYKAAYLNACKNCKKVFSDVLSPDYIYNLKYFLEKQKLSRKLPNYQLSIADVVGVSVLILFAFFFDG